MDPNISALAAYPGQYEKKLFSTLYNGLDVANDCTLVTGVKNKHQLTKLTVGAGVRPYSPTFSVSDDDLEYTGRTLEVNLAKRELQIEPLKYRSTWMSEVMRPGVNPDDIPFAQYVWEQVFGRIAQEVNDNAAYSGTYNASGTNAAAIATGFGTLIANAITATTVTPVSTGAISSTNAVAAVEQMAKAMPVAYRRAGFNVYVSFNVFDKYQEDYREKYKKYTELNENGHIHIDTFGRRVALVPATWMGNSQRIICTPKENLLVGTDEMSDWSDRITTAPDIWTLKAGIAFAIGFQIRDLDALRVNDQA